MDRKPRILGWEIHTIKWWMGVSSINCYPDRWTCLDLGAPYFGVTNLKEDSTLKDDKVQVWYWFLEGMIWMMFHEARTNVVLGRKSHQSQDTWSEMSRHIGVSENGLYPQLWPSIGKGSSSNGIGGIFRQENTSWCWGEINVYNYATLTSISGDMGQKKLWCNISHLLWFHTPGSIFGEIPPMFHQGTSPERWNMNLGGG